MTFGFLVLSHRKSIKKIYALSATPKNAFMSEFNCSEIGGNPGVLGQSISEHGCSIRECTSTVRCSSSGLS